MANQKEYHVRKVVPTEEGCESINEAAESLKERALAFPVGSVVWFMYYNKVCTGKVLWHELVVNGSAIIVSARLSFTDDERPDYICQSADVLKDFLFEHIIIFKDPMHNKTTTDHRQGE